MGAADKEEKEEVELRRDRKRGEGGNKRDGFVRRGGGQKKEVFALLSVVKSFFHNVTCSLRPPHDDDGGGRSPACFARERER